MTSFRHDLTQRQKYWVVAGTALAGLLLLWVFLFSPVIDGKRQIERRISAQKQQLQTMEMLAGKYKSFTHYSGKIRRILAKRSRDFTLFSYLDQKAADSGVKGNIISMHPIQGLTNGVYTERILEVKIEKVTMKQFLNFLYAVESGPDLVVTGKVNALKAGDNPDYMDVWIQFVTVETL